jgi:CDP-glycerol glycerophosphotransferase (TagB/SpsB family)
MLKRVFGFLKNLIALIINYCWKFIPRNKKIWLYGGFGKRFIDNSKYLFIILNESELGIKHIWITDSHEDEITIRNLGFLCYRRKTFKGTYYSLRAKVYIYGCYPDEINYFAFSGGAFLFNLWHGIPLKKIEYDIERGPLRKLYHPKGILERISTFSTRPVKFIKSEAILCPSVDYTEIFRRAFRINVNNICEASYPRTSVFFWNEAKLLSHIEKYEPFELKSLIERCQQFKEVWIYMPTFRDADPYFIHKSITDFKVLDQKCKNSNVLFLLKLHLATNIDFDEHQLTNIIFVPNHFDVYPLMPFTTTLLTDYSSVFLDYQLLNKKIVFYPFDLDEYLSRSRQMYFSYDQLIFGHKIYSFDELISILGRDNSLHENISYTRSINTSDGSDKIVSFIKDKIGLT